MSLFRTTFDIEKKKKSFLFVAFVNNRRMGGKKKGGVVSFEIAMKKKKKKKCRLLSTLEGLLEKVVNCVTNVRNERPLYAKVSKG